MSEKIMLIDGNSIINRAFYALPVLTNNSGEFTNAVYGFLNIFFKLFDEENPDYVVVAFDLPAPTFRHKKYDQYKGTRKAMPEELRPQLPLLKSLLKKMNVKIFEMEGFEADDILGTLACRSDNIGLDTVVVSGDRDLLQLASERIKIRIPKTKAGRTEVEDYYAADVVERIGVTPTEYIDVKALMGDSSDNIPGVPGIGEKTALKIIQEYKNIETAIENAEHLKPKRASENLAEFKEQALLSKELATIIKDVPIEFDKSEARVNNIFNDEALEEVTRLEFRSLLSRFKKRDVQPDSPQPENSGFKYAKTGEEAEGCISEIIKTDRVTAFELIFNDWRELCGICLTNRDGECFYTAVQENMNETRILEICRPFFVADVKKITHDYKKQLTFLKRKGMTLKNVIFDTMLGAYIINSSKGSYPVDSVALDFLGENLPSADEVFGKGKNRVKNVDQRVMLDFACKRVETIFRAYPIMDGIISTNGQRQLYYEIELPLSDVLADMETTGIRVNPQELIEYGKGLDEFIETLSGEIYDLAGEEFNINSPQQLGVILFEKLGLKGSKKTKQGYSTAAEVLEKLSYHPIAEKVLEYRTYTKLKSTYVDGLLAVIDQNTGKIYSTFNQTITSTGRISSVEPNLQNIPVRLELGKKLRKAFIPSDGDFIFMDGDYSQIELRVLAHMSEDEVLINAFKEGQDIHRLTASQVFNTPFDEVTSRQRSNAKAVNFGIIYGIGAYSLSQDLGITRKEAERYIDGYFQKYPKIKNFMDDRVKKATEDGYASTIFGRRRFIPELTASNFVTRAFGERVAMNMPIQGTAADIIKIAMIKVHKRLKEEKLASRIVLQVHDELLLEVKRDEAEIVKGILKHEMENAVLLSVPLDTDFHRGETWYDTK